LVLKSENKKHQRTYSSFLIRLGALDALFISSVGLLTTGSRRSPPVFLSLIFFSPAEGFCCCGDIEEKHAVSIPNVRPIRDSIRAPPPPPPRLVPTTFENALTVLQFVVVVVMAVKRKDMIIVLLSPQPILIYLSKLGSCSQQRVWLLLLLPLPIVICVPPWRSFCPSIDVEHCSDGSRHLDCRRLDG
jgi:hypothetical protein